MDRQAGGGILGLHFDRWRPGGEDTGPDDRFAFEPDQRSLALGTIDAGHRTQDFLPVLGRSAEAIRDAVPDPPQLAQMRFGVPAVGGGVRA